MVKKKEAWFKKKEAWFRKKGSEKKKHGVEKQHHTYLVPPPRGLFAFGFPSCQIHPDHDLHFDHRPHLAPNAPQPPATERETERNREKPRETERNREKLRETERNREKPRETERNRGR
jgi:hypothetical protein